jgi:predicted transcriptional regulator with HTH domain
VNSAIKLVDIGIVECPQENGISDYRFHTVCLPAQP